MRPIYGCPENFRVSVTTHTATFPEIFNGFFPIEPMNVRTKFINFVALPVPEIIIGGTKKLGSPCAHAPFLQNF